MDFDFPNLVEPADKDAVLRFFCEGLEEIVPSGLVSKEETIYVASKLASYAQDSTEPNDLYPPSKDLSEFFDFFVLRPGVVLMDYELLINACGQILLLNGFFRDQMRHRHKVEWYDELGRTFYRRLASLSTGPRRRRLFSRMASNMHIWNPTCCKLQRNLAENSADRQYLICRD